MTDETLALIFRSLNAVVWTALLFRTVREHRGLMGIVVVGTLATGTWLLVVGGLVPFDVIDPALARLIYTAWTVPALLAGLAIASIRSTAR